MAPKKPSKDQLAELFESLNTGLPAVEPLKASEIVTYPALAGILSTLEERHNGLVALMNQRFGTLENMSRDRSDQLGKVEHSLEKRIDEEVSRNDKRYNWILVGVGTAIVAEVLRFFVVKA